MSFQSRRPSGSQQRSKDRERRPSDAGEAAKPVKAVLLPRHQIIAPAPQIGAATHSLARPAGQGSAAGGPSTTGNVAPVASATHASDNAPRVVTASDGSVHTTWEVWPSRDLGDRKYTKKRIRGIPEERSESDDEDSEAESSDDSEDNEEDSDGYTKSKDPARDYAFGMVIEMRLVPPSKSSAVTRLTARPNDRYPGGSRVGIRRFVVIEAPDPTTRIFKALPIKTYNGRGVAAIGVVKSHHAVIYTRPPPTATAAEQPQRHPRTGILEQGMRTQPILVIPLDRLRPLDPMARLDFFDITEFDSNVRNAKVYGRVDSNYQGALRFQYQAVWATIAQTTGQRTVPTLQHQQPQPQQRQFAQFPAIQQQSGTQNASQQPASDPQPVLQQKPPQQQLAQPQTTQQPVGQQRAGQQQQMQLQPTQQQMPQQQIPQQRIPQQQIPQQRTTEQQAAQQATQQQLAQQQAIHFREYIETQTGNGYSREQALTALARSYIQSGQHDETSARNFIIARLALLQQPRVQPANASGIRAQRTGQNRAGGVPRVPGQSRAAAASRYGPAASSVESEDHGSGEDDLSEDESAEEDSEPGPAS